MGAAGERQNYNDDREATVNDKPIPETVEVDGITYQLPSQSDLARQIGTILAGGKVFVLADDDETWEDVGDANDITALPESRDENSEI